VYTPLVASSGRCDDERYCLQQETLLGIAVDYMLSRSWNDIKAALGLSDKQLRHFFGSDE
jgi:hypothetical protein